MSQSRIIECELRHIGTVSLYDDSFRINLHDASLLSAVECVYAFTVEDEVVRVGSSKAPLGKRFKAWERDVSRALNGLPSPTSQLEADGWRARLSVSAGKVYARPGTLVCTPVGTFRAYLDEERALIQELRPVFCRR